MKSGDICDVWSDLLFDVPCSVCRTESGRCIGDDHLSASVHHARCVALLTAAEQVRAGHAKEAGA